MSNIQEALRGRITQDRYKDLLSQIGNSNNSNLDLQSLLVQILPALGKVTGPENGNDGKINPIDLISKLDSSILGPLLEMMQCLQPEESSFAPFRSNGNPDNGRDPFNINRERMNNWLNESIAEKPESLHSPNMNVTDQQQPNTSSSSNNEASYRQRNFSGSHINNSSCSSTSSTANRYHQNAFTSSQMSPVNVNCSPKNNTESSFMNDFQQQISPEMESSGGQNHIMGGSLPQISNEARHHQMFEPDRVDEHLIEESARDSEKKLQELLAARSNYTSAADYSHRNNILPSIDRMRSGSPNLDRPIGLSDRNPETDMYHLHHAHQNAQTSPDKQSSEDYSYSDDLQHNGQGTIKLEEQDGFEPEYDAHGLLVTSSGRNRGLGKANEPRFCCQVCGDVAAGFHCGAYVCEACKKFYLRCLKNGGSVAYSCPKTQECVISKETRSHCQYCRYQKCLSLGMYKPGRDDSKHLRVDFKSIPCKVCNAPSSGFHFGAITCEGCKGFFRRMVKEKLHKKFVCTAGGSCDVASSNRTACKACRYQKCLEIGMALEGTRLGRQSNSVKRNTLIQYLNNGMDVALFPKIGESGPEESHQKVDKLLKPATTERIVTPQVLPDLVSVKQETEMDEGYLRYMNTKESSGENSYTMAQQPQQQQENSSHKNNLSGKDYLFVDTSDNMNRSKVLDLDRQSVGPYGRRNSLLGDQGGDVKPFPFGTEKIMALVDNVSANKRTDLLDKIFGGGGDSSNSKRKISESDTSDPGTIKHHKTSEMFTSSNLNPPNSTVSSNPHQAAINQHQRFQRTSSIEGNNEKHGPKLSVASEQSPLSSLNSPNSMGSPSSQSSSYNELRLKDPRWCAVDGSNPNRKKMVKTFLSQVPQTEVDHCFPRKESFDPRSEAADQASGLGSINGTPTVKKRLLSGGKNKTFTLYFLTSVIKLDMP